LITSSAKRVFASSAGAIANGWKLNFSDVEADYEPKFSIAFFGGADLQATAGYLTLTSTLTICTTFGHSMDLGFFTAIGRPPSTFDSISAYSLLSFGVRAQDGQCCVAIIDHDAVGSAKGETLLKSDIVAAALFNGSASFQVNIIGDTAAEDGIIWKVNGTSYGATPRTAMFLAIDTDTRSTGLVQAGFPTLTGSLTLSFGFVPQAFGVVAGNTTLTNNLRENVDALITVSIGDEDSAYSHHISTRDGLGTSDTKNYGAPVAFQLYHPDGTSILQTLETHNFVANGVATTYSDASDPYERQYFAWGVQEAESVGGVTVPIMYNFYRMMRGGS
jgi:hypothetical protein